MRKGQDIADRLLRFGASALTLVEDIPASRNKNHLGHQLVRAATAGGANYEEARSAESRRDFVHKVRIAAKEIREAWYWLKMLRETRIVDGIDELIDEADQLIAILTASANTARRGGS